MNSTKIEWTDLSWNPITGCLHPCPYCYARAIYRRRGWDFAPAFRPERLEQPIRKRKGKRIFVCSVADLFGEWVPREWIDSVLAVVRECPQHTFQFLTKNPERLGTVDWPGNCWVGATATDAESMLRAVVALVDVDAPVRFVSAEPLLADPETAAADLADLDWMIIGAQSGPRSIQPEQDWVERLTSAAKGAGCAVFYKPNLSAETWPEPPREFPSVPTHRLASAPPPSLFQSPTS